MSNIKFYEPVTLVLIGVMFASQIGAAALGLYDRNKRENCKTLEKLYLADNYTESFVYDYTNNKCTFKLTIKKK